MNPLPATKGRAVILHTRGRTSGSVTRLAGPGDVGRLIKPFVFLDFFDHQGAPFNGPLHPHSGIATLTYVMEGAVSYIDPSGATGIIAAGGVEWMQAGRGMWHGGGIEEPHRTRGFQLWIALPPDQELGTPASVFQAPEDVQDDGPVRVLLGRYGAASTDIAFTSSINYLAVGLKEGERWRYEPPSGHTVCWAAVGTGRLDAGVDRGASIGPAELAVFEESNDPIDFLARRDTTFVLGSAVKHPHPLVTGYYSVHTSEAALAQGEAEIQRIGRRLHTGKTRSPE